MILYYLLSIIKKVNLFVKKGNEKPDEKC